MTVTYVNELYDVDEGSSISEVKSQDKTEGRPKLHTPSKLPPSPPPKPRTSWKLPHYPRRIVTNRRNCLCHSGNLEGVGAVPQCTEVGTSLKSQRVTFQLRQSSCSAIGQLANRFTTHSHEGVAPPRGTCMLAKGRSH